MAKIHGKNGTIIITGSVGDSYNISGNGNECTLDMSYPMEDDTSFQDVAVQRAPSSLGDGKFDISLWADQTPASANLLILRGLQGGSTTLIWGPAGSATNSMKYIGYMGVTDVQLNATPKGLVTCKATMELVSGSMTSTCWA